MSIERNGPIARAPPVAAATMMSTGACASQVAETEAGSRTSHVARVILCAAATSSALLGDRLMATTSAPAALSMTEVARPMPDVPPKTSAFLPCNWTCDWALALHVELAARAPIKATDAALVRRSDRI